MEQLWDLHTHLLRYGRIIKDIDFSTEDGCHRIRVFSYEGILYYDYMHNGNILECHKLEPAKED